MYKMGYLPVDNTLWLTLVDQKDVNKILPPISQATIPLRSELTTYTARAHNNLYLWYPTYEYWFITTSSVGYDNANTSTILKVF